MTNTKNLEDGTDQEDEVVHVQTDAAASSAGDGEEDGASWTTARTQVSSAPCCKNA